MIEKNLSEYDLHVQIMDYLRLRLPRGSVVHHSPNESKATVQWRVKQRRLGLRPGWPDIEIFVLLTWWQPGVRWSPIFLEVKTKRGRLTGSQKAVHSDLKASGCRVFTVRTLNDVEDALKNLLVEDERGVRF